MIIYSPSKYYTPETEADRSAAFLPIVMRALRARGIVTDVDRKRFMFPDISVLRNPFGLPDMDKAVERKAAVSAEIARRRARQQEIELHFQHLRELDLLTEFRDEDWLAMVDHMTVHSKSDIWITFKDGSEIKAGERDG